ncbi:hypothetical protein [Terrarubrum flagellatum]|uniref:hypothetical protein n=1 Tax=Terrirubrum flagellatum TaxID=2895980 RepID=UPI003144DC0F
MNLARFIFSAAAASLVLTTLAQSALAAESCAKEVGPAKARRYARDCVEVSPATHPPCNALNPCDLILGEIKRSCQLFAGNGRPQICAAYR